MLERESEPFVVDVREWKASFQDALRLRNDTRRCHVRKRAEVFIANVREWKAGFR